MNNYQMQNFNNESSSAKGKLILGIVFVGISLFLFILEIACVFIQMALISVVLFLIGFPLFCVGVPFLIIGIVGTIKANRAVNMANQPNAQLNSQWQPQAEPQAQWQQPQADPQTQWQPRGYTQYQQQGFNEQANASNGFVPLDWRKYAPLEAGVSLKPGKDYKFHRAEGFAGSVPQSFVNRTFPKCPVCCSKEPYWTIAQHNQMSWKGNLYLFKCSCCDSIISMSMPDVTTLGNGGTGFAANPSVGLTNLMFKSNSGKEVGAVYAVIESTGRSGVDPECQGKEFKLEQLQDMFLRM